MAEQAALEVSPRRHVLVAQVERQHQVEQDVVVIAGVERDAVERAGRGYAAQHIQRAVAIERRDLDGDDVVDRREAPPERHRQHQAAHGGLQVEADERYLARDRLRVRDQLVLARALKRGEREEPRVVAEPARDLRLAQGLRGAAGEPRDHHRSCARPVGGGAHGELEHRLEQASLADGELGGVHADRQSARAGVEIVARERALASRVEPAISVERQRMRRDHHPLAQGGKHLRRPILPARRHGLSFARAPIAWPTASTL